MLKDAIFSFKLGLEADQSSIRFGGYDEAIVTNARNQFPNTIGVHWMTQNSQYHW